MVVAFNPTPFNTATLEDPFVLLAMVVPEKFPPESKYKTLFSP